MGRDKLRETSAGVYHVTNKGNNGADVFLDNFDFFEFKTIVGKVKREIGFDIYHYTILNNHNHFILSVKDEMLPKILQKIQLGYSKYHARRYNRKGHLWQSRYFSSPLWNEYYQWVCGLYVNANAVRAHLVENPASYFWSSAKYYLDGAPDPLITPDPLFMDLGENMAERRSAYKAMLEDYCAMKNDGDEKRWEAKQ